eukprot:GDKI01014317.1.p1 GENE.GDKI01014317.1~~GDKI01014317.1.p1  ORF type:complete len:109 (+),score=0.67 GDKI01014317.1:42-368(+)
MRKPTSWTTRVRAYQRWGPGWKPQSWLTDRRFVEWQTIKWSRPWRLTRLGNSKIPQTYVEAGPKYCNMSKLHQQDQAVSPVRPPFWSMMSPTRNPAMKWGPGQKGYGY